MKMDFAVTQRGEPMIKVMIFPSHRRAEYAFKEWTREHEDEILGLNSRDLSVINRSGDELHFECESGFERWAKGRKYEIITDYRP